MKFNRLYFILPLFITLSCESFLEDMSYKKSRNRLINSIETEYSGIVVETFSPRKNMEDTHFVTNRRDTLVPSNSKVLKVLQIGDSILKPRNDNYIYIYNDGIDRKLWFMKIPEKYRKDEKFPQEWKNKWLEATTE